MKRVVWLTDIHLNFLLEHKVREFLGQVARAEPDALLVGGDIAEAHNIDVYLNLLLETTTVPIYFVLGNHDYYYGSIGETRQRVAQMCAERPRLHFLTGGGVETLTPRVGLVGHDGWADGRAGNYERSLVRMNDFKLIAELVPYGKLERWDVLKSLGNQAAAHFRRVLPIAFEQFDRVVLLTHVPPLREACWHEGGLSNDQWAPHFTCVAVGEALLELMAERPDKKLIVLCGHTHGHGEADPLPNLHIMTGGAKYGTPEIQKVLEFE